MMNSNGIYSIRSVGDPCLNQQVTDINNFDSKLASMIIAMKNFLGGNTIGLAANQVGILKNFFVWQLDGKPQEVINPQIVDWGPGTLDHVEGCLSLPDRHFIIRRSKRVVLEGFDINEKPLHIEAVDLKAALFQHEVDHLRGIIGISSPNYIGNPEEMSLLHESQY
jgi:peptide deformylase